MALASPKAAAKVAFTQKITPKIIQSSVSVAITDVSLDVSSGWRDLNQKRVDELKQAFLDGEYGLNVFAEAVPDPA